MSRPHSSSSRENAPNAAPPSTAPSIPLHRPTLDSLEGDAVQDLIARGAFASAGAALMACEARLGEALGVSVRGTTSATHALEMAMQLAGLGPGDEVILPAYNFPSAATAVLSCGATPVFAAVQEHDLNVDPADVASLVGPQTRALVMLHYAGVPCDAERLRAVARTHGMTTIEDAALALGSASRGVPCGALGDFGCLSFNYNKVLTCGEGGALTFRDPDRSHEADVLREMGTDRAAFRRGEVSRYTWRGAGSSLIPSEFLMAILNVQLGRLERVVRRRSVLFARYGALLTDWARQHDVQLPRPDAADTVNGGLFWMTFPDVDAATSCSGHLRRHGIESAAHYDDLSQTPAGRRFRRSERLASNAAVTLPRRLLRLPLHAELGDDELHQVCEVLAQWRVGA